MPPAAAVYFSLIISWRSVDLEDMLKERWDTVAYSCRYGGAGAFWHQLDTPDLVRFCNAVGRLVEEEGKGRT